MTKRIDDQLKDKVSHILYEQQDMDVSQVEVEVLESSVFIRGTVDSESTKMAVENSLSGLEEIHEVFNELVIRQVDSEMDVSFGITNDLERDEQFRAEKLP
jgi:osmotically-inducible protein OsmY